MRREQREAAVERRREHRRGHEGGCGAPEVVRDGAPHGAEREVSHRRDDHHQPDRLLVQAHRGQERRHEGLHERLRAPEEEEADAFVDLREMADDRTVVVVEDFFVKTEEVRENIALVVAEEEAIVVFTLT